MLHTKRSIAVQHLLLIQSYLTILQHTLVFRDDFLLFSNVWCVVYVFQFVQLKLIESEYENFTNEFMLTDCCYFRRWYQVVYHS